MNLDLCPTCGGADFVIKEGHERPCPNPRCWRGLIQVDRRPVSKIEDSPVSLVKDRWAKTGTWDQSDPRWWGGKNPMSD